MNQSTSNPNQQVNATGLRIELERTIKAPIADVFEVLLEQTGPSFESPDGNSLSLKLEAFPGGRWYRDLGDNSGHLWGHVQAMIPPSPGMAYQRPLVYFLRNGPTSVAKLYFQRDFRWVVAFWGSRIRPSPT